MLYSYYLETYIMKKIPNIYNANCPTRLILDRIADKWTVLIIGQLSSGTLRFNELKRSVPGITQKMLTQTLKGLERDGIIVRKIYATVPPKVEYTLTKLGKSLIRVVEAIRTWAETNVKDILQSQAKYDSKF
ncbi:putative HTH-type transcriptional regulator YybR [Aquicella siphonis]|uniref:Putative HTH-type transcriptional regulator YybR n=2 Tax=Aquicella siphonis TaxID=254247 RepID=A0A5E4PEF4_9COXI|nr:putative HTH-type transcriptional regulator YybR [Aquicella siphonis]